MNTINLKLPDNSMLSLNEAITLIENYIDKNPATIEFYDLTNTGPHDDIMPLDLLSLNALNAFANQKPMPLMTRIWNHRHSISSLIAPITKSNIETLSEQEFNNQVNLLLPALHEIEGISGFGGHGTRASKLLHRLRPNIMPIWDKNIGKWYGGEDQSWSNFLDMVFSNLKEDENIRCILAVQGKISKHLYPLRIWDIILWQQ